MVFVKIIPRSIGFYVLKSPDHKPYRSFYRKNAQMRKTKSLPVSQIKSEKNINYDMVHDKQALPMCYYRGLVCVVKKLAK